MKTKIIGLLLCSLLWIMSCHTQKHNSATIQDNSKNSLDWNGRYIGTLPGQEDTTTITIITLQEDQTYTCEQMTSGKNIIPTHKGTFTWDKRGQYITLQQSSVTPNSFKVGENKLIPVKNNGSEIATTSRKNTLVKIESDIIEKYWKLTEVYGKPILMDNTRNREPHLILKETQRVNGNGGCNNYNGSYTLQGNTLHFSRIAATLMACENMEVESLFFKALEETKSFISTADTLILYNADSVLVAQFSVVYL